MEHTCKAIHAAIGLAKPHCPTYILSLDTRLRGHCIACRGQAFVVVGLQSAPTLQ